MSTSTLTSSRINYLVHKESGEYHLYSKDKWEHIYIGRQSSSQYNGRGYNSGIFEMKLYNMPNRKKIAKINSVSIKFKTNNNNEGYNYCTVRFDYVGMDPGVDQSLWRVGASNETLSLDEGDTKTFTTTDKVTCKNFRNLIINSKSGENFYFRIQRTSGQGIYSKTQVEITIDFDESNIHYCYNGTWKQCIPYYYTNGQWKQCIAYYHKDSEWKQT